MLQIPDSLIVNYSASPQVYRRGMDYYRKGRIKSIRIQEDKLIIYSVVKGTREYNVRVNFADDGAFLSAVCNCPASRKYWGHCKHIVAVLLHLKWLKDKSSFKSILAKRTARELFQHFQYSPSLIKTPVTLEPVYEFRPENERKFDVSSFLSFKIGVDRKYVIRNIGRFLEQLKQGETVEFGKNFTYDPYWHDISENQKPLMDFLYELYDINSFGAAEIHSHSGLFRDKYICMPDALVKRFFSIMEGQGFTAVIQGQTYEDIRVRKEPIPLVFSVDSEGDDLALDLILDGSFSPITADWTYLLIGNSIYQPPKSQLQNILPFLKVINRTGGSRLLFTKEDKERFVSEVLPYAGKAGQVQISDRVNEAIIEEPLVPEIFFDREGRSIKARVQFKYGVRVIDPFDPVAGNWGKDDRILLRDIDTERRILELFEQYSFLVRPHGVFLEDEERIFEFFHTGLPQLLEFAMVYYSDDFKIIIRENTSYAAGIRLSSDTDLLEFTFDIGDIERSELDQVFSALREKKRYYRLKDGSFLPLDSSELKGLAQIIDDIGIRHKELEQGIIEMPKYRALYLDRQLREAGLSDIRVNTGFSKLVSDIQAPGSIPNKLPVSLETTLRDYQRLGFRWMKTLTHYGLGGILADDMGLGKTLQVLVLLLSDKEEGLCTEPSLVVAPTSLIYNWEAEVEKFVPNLKVLIITGTREERSKLMEQIPLADLVITSYPLIRRDKEDYEPYTFRYCIIDEAQHIKNPLSLGAKAVKSIRAGKRLALTGTPMENSLSELWSIFDFIMPGYLYSHAKFISKFEKPIIKEKDEEAVENLSRHIKPFILRRLKTDVLKELPEKIENKMIAELTEEQKKVYLAYLAQIRGELRVEIDRSGMERSHIKILAALTRLRQICCHPGVFLENYKGESGKLLLLDEIIPEALKGGHRILLFSQFTSMLKLIRQRLEAKKVNTFYLDGNTAALERSQLVKSFNDGEGDVFLISLKAGGTGLNLTGADTVIHFDPWWNPAVEDQASDRAYRIGQEKVVHVIRLITKGTIEEKIERLKEQKRNLTDAVIQPGETFISKMTEEELMALFE